MSESFIVKLNDQIVHTYKSVANPARLRRFFEEMDHDMLKGVQLGDDFISQPSGFQKQQYVATILVNSLENKDLNTVQIMSAYLAKRNPDLIEIRVTSDDNLMNMILITK